MDVLHLLEFNTQHCIDFLYIIKLLQIMTAADSVACKRRPLFLGSNKNILCGS